MLGRSIVSMGAWSKPGRTRLSDWRGIEKDGGASASPELDLNAKGLGARFDREHVDERSARVSLEMQREA